MKELKRTYFWIHRATSDCRAIETSVDERNCNESQGM